MKSRTRAKLHMRRSIMLVEWRQIMKPHCFFAHIAFATDARVRATPEATANLLIEINDAALTAGGKKKHLKPSALTKPQKVKLAGGIAKAAARDYLKSQREFHKFPVQRFVDFDLTRNPSYISIRPAPSKVLPNDSKVWRLAETEAEQVRGQPLSAARNRRSKLVPVNVGG